MNHHPASITKVENHQFDHQQLVIRHALCPEWDDIYASEITSSIVNTDRCYADRETKGKHQSLV